MRHDRHRSPRRKQHAASSRLGLRRRLRAHRADGPPPPGVRGHPDPFTLPTLESHRQRTSTQLPATDQRTGPEKSLQSYMHEPPRCRILASRLPLLRPGRHAGQAAALIVVGRGSPEPIPSPTRTDLHRIQHGRPRSRRQGRFTCQTTPAGRSSAPRFHFQPKLGIRSNPSLVLINPGGIRSPRRRRRRATSATSEPAWRLFGELRRRARRGRAS